MVTIEYECETDFDLGLDCPALAKMVAEKVLDMEKCPWDADVYKRQPEYHPVCKCLQFEQVEFHF